MHKIGRASNAGANKRKRTNEVIDESDDFIYEIERQIRGI